MSSTVTGTVTTSVTLGHGTYSSPLTIAQGAEVSYGGTAAAIYSAYFATIVNLGTLSDTGPNGVQLAHGGVVDNSGLLTGQQHAILIEGTSGTVTNSGYISASVDIAVGLFHGGVVTNASQGTISASAVTGAGVFVTGTYGSVTNFGLIEGGGNIGVLEAAGGRVSNTSSGSITGFQNGVFINGGLGTVVNEGYINVTGTNGTPIYIQNGGNLTNTSSGTVTGNQFGAFVEGGLGIVVNAGTIQGGADGLILGDGGAVTNSAAGLISGLTNGVYEKFRATATVTNDGSIIATTPGGAGVDLADGGVVNNNAGGSIVGPGFGIFIAGGPGTVVNDGSLAGADGIELQDGGIVTNNAGASIVSTANGVYFGAAAAGTIVNSGGIGASGASGAGIDMAKGGIVTNTASGAISGAAFGVFINGTAGSVVNSGTITGSHGVALEAGGGVTNTSSGYITGNVAGVFINGAFGGVVNLGSISATAASGAAVDIESGGSVTNGLGASITGKEIGVYVTGGAGYVANAGTIAATGPNGVGIDLKRGGTIVDSGLIAGASEAIYLGGSGSNLLKLEAGYSLSGAVFGSGGATNTLELSGSLGSVTAGFNNLDLFNFGAVKFGAPHGYDETLLITNTAALPGTIEGFSRYHEIIDLRQLTNPSAAVFNYDSATDRLTITEGTQSVTLQLAGDLSQVVWRAASDGHGGTDIEPACYLAGTRILTPEGEVAVEELAIGDRVITVSGEAKRIKWIARRAYDARFAARNRQVIPVRIKCGALDGERPHRDLFVSPRHALFIDGALVPAAALLDGISIVQEDRVGTIDYYHIELAEHDVIYAEGAAAETYVDCGNRSMFQNEHEFDLLYPGEDPPRWSYCAPLVESGPELERIRQRIGRRAGSSAARARQATAEVSDWHAAGKFAPAAPPAGIAAPVIVRLART